MGHWTWNRTDWFRDPNTGKRRPQHRPESEWVRRHLPDLKIINEESWAAARERRLLSKKKFPRFGSKPEPGSIPGTPVKYLLSGLLICGECGGAMTLLGGKAKETKAGVHDYRQYGCANHKKGSQFCTNAKTISRIKIEGAVVDGLKREVLRPHVVQRFIQKLTKALKDKLNHTSTQVEFSKLEKAILEQREQVERLINVAAAGAQGSDVLAKAIAEREAKLRELEAQAETLRQLPAPAEVIPTRPRSKPS